MTEARVKAFCKAHEGETIYDLWYNFNFPKHFILTLKTRDNKFMVSHLIWKESPHETLYEYFKSLEKALDYITSNS